MNDWINTLFKDPQMLHMDHCQRSEDLNLGMGWIYYSLTRLYRPKHIVVIGSWRGFAPLVFGKALLDNNEQGRVTFIDPSLVDDFWEDPEKTHAHFTRHNVTNIDHFLMTTQRFIAAPAFAALGPVGFLMIDGYHTRDQAKLDYEAFSPLLGQNGIALFHDSSATDKISTIYGPEKPYKVDVSLFIEELRQDRALEIFHLPLATGLTLVKRKSS